MQNQHLLDTTNTLEAQQCGQGRIFHTVARTASMLPSRYEVAPSECNLSLPNLYNLDAWHV